MFLIRYFWYVLRHKWYVMLECFKLKQYWRGVTHDLSKFLPDEFIPYARYFYGKYRKQSELNTYEKTYYWDCIKTQEQVEEDFNLAWLKHQKRNKHHWQYWILEEDSGKQILLPMPKIYYLEMICDWKGAGKAINGKDDTRGWYEKNYLNIKLNKETRGIIQSLIGSLLSI